MCCSARLYRFQHFIPERPRGRYAIPVFECRGTRSRYGSARRRRILSCCQRSSNSRIKAGTCGSSRALTGRKTPRWKIACGRAPPDGRRDGSHAQDRVMRAPLLGKAVGDSGAADPGADDRYINCRADHSFVRPTGRMLPTVAPNSSARQIERVSPNEQPLWVDQLSDGRHRSCPCARPPVFPHQCRSGRAWHPTRDKPAVRHRR